MPEWTVKAGQKYGRWTVKEVGVYDPFSNATRKRKKVLCECSCKDHTLRYLNAHQLTAGLSKSCGCLAHEQLAKRNAAKSSVQVGNRYGKLIIIKDLGFRKQASRDKNERWSLCKCDCGNTVEVSNNMLQSGWKKSCGCMTSHGEFLIERMLQEYNINYKKQYSFDDLVTKTNTKLRFDFAIFTKNNELKFLIEFDGRQHFDGPEAKWTNSDSLAEIQYRDNLKNEYCKKNNILLKRIPYTDIKIITLEKILKNDYNVN